MQQRLHGVLRRRVLRLLSVATVALAAAAAIADAAGALTSDMPSSS